MGHDIPSSGSRSLGVQGGIEIHVWGFQFGVFGTGFLPFLPFKHDPITSRTKSEIFRATELSNPESLIKPVSQRCCGPSVLHASRTSQPGKTTNSQPEISACKTTLPSPSRHKRLRLKVWGLWVSAFVKYCRAPDAVGSASCGSKSSTSIWACFGGNIRSSCLEGLGNSIPTNKGATSCTVSNLRRASKA